MIDFIPLDFIIIHMTMDRSLCAICAWRRDCKKKFSHGENVHCPDFTKDLTIKVKEKEQAQTKQQPGKKKKPSDIHLL